MKPYARPLSSSLSLDRTADSRAASMIHLAVTLSTLLADARKARHRRGRRDRNHGRSRLPLPRILALLKGDKCECTLTHRSTTRRTPVTSGRCSASEKLPSSSRLPLAGDTQSRRCSTEASSNPQFTSSHHLTNAPTPLPYFRSVARGGRMPFPIRGGEGPTTRDTPRAGYRPGRSHGGDDTLSVHTQRKHAVCYRFSASRTYDS